MEPQVFDAPVLKTPLPQLTLWQRERTAFFQLLPKLLQSQRGQYAAVYNEQIVDSGPDSIELALRVYKKYGRHPVYIGLVSEQPRAARIPRRHEILLTLPS